MGRANNIELEHLRQVYDLEHPHLQCFGIDESFACCLLKNLSQFADQTIINSPDFYSRHDRAVIGIEHFEYDASRKNRNGSAERQGLERANRDFLKKARKDAIRGHGLQKEYKVGTASSVDTLKANFLNNFKKHKDKIDIYKTNLNEHFNIEDPPIWFLAEDYSVMGPMFNSGFIIDGYPEFPLLPVFYKDIYDEILTSQIDGVILASPFPISNHIVFVKNTIRSFNDLIKHYNFDKNPSIQFFNDMSYGFCSFCVPD